jgi:hypothetical protein
MRLPVSVTSPADVSRLAREVEIIDDTLLQLGLKSGGGAEAKLPKTSRLMDQTVELNGLNLLLPEHRGALKSFLESIRKQAPVMHFSFSADPSQTFLEKLVVWLRREIHPQVLMNVGLQPNIGAGCIVRTTNKQFDFSLRQDFAKKRDLLLKQLSAKPAGEAKQ